MKNEGIILIEPIRAEEHNIALNSDWIVSNGVSNKVLTMFWDFRHLLDV